ncbi:hypothetical protein CKA32_002812 [Geitlerinema sp. FC II]|nr:hypothetical protein CKA32_002812 [Geitlerinema sp. FC II]
MRQALMSRSSESQPSPETFDARFLTRVYPEFRSEIDRILQLVKVLETDTQRSPEQRVQDYQKIRAAAQHMSVLLIEALDELRDRP